MAPAFTYDSQGIPVSVQVGSDPSTAPRYYYVYNAHGDVTFLTDSSGAVVASYLYDSWGNLTSSTETFANGWTNPYRYDGRDGARYDASDGLYWLSVRAYDPSLGRFLSRDPLGRAPLFGVNDNPYVYAGNNPLSNVDPSGQRYANSGVRHAPSGSSSLSHVKATHHPKASRPVAQGPCSGKSKCVIFITGVNLGWSKAYSPVSDDVHLWNSWTQRLVHDAGYFLLEAKDAADGAMQLHAYLQRLHDQGFRGKVSVVGHSNGAASIFTYFAQKAVGNYGGDYPISRFESIDAPTGLTTFALAGPVGWAAVALWAGWSHQSMEYAELYIEAHGIKGIWAFDVWDPVAGPSFGPWTTIVSNGGNWWNPEATHLYLAQNPTSAMLNFM